MRPYKRNAVPIIATDRFRPVFIVGALIIALVAGYLLLQDVGVLRQKTAQLRLEDTRLVAIQRSVDKEKKAIKLAKKMPPGVLPSEPAITVLKRLEAAWADDISLLRVETDLTKGSMQLHINAQSREGLFTFVERLKQQFGNNVFLQRHGQNASNDQDWLLDASVSLGWK